MNDIRRIRGAAALAALVASFVLPSCARKEPLSREEQRLLGSLDAAHALEEIRAFSESVVTDPSGLGAGTASAGTEQEVRLAAWVEEKFRAHGLEVERHTFPVRVHQYGEVNLTAGARVPAVILYGSPAISGRRDSGRYSRGNWRGGEVLRAQMVFGGSGTRADLDAAGNLNGRIVLLLRNDDLTGWPSLAILEAAQRGAAAVVFYGVTGEGTLLADALRQDSVLQANAIPAFSIRRTDGERLREEVARRPIEAEISATGEERDGTSVSVIGRLPGSRFPDENIIVSAHIDRWHAGCQDNASGVGTLLELVRAFAGRGTPARTLVFVAIGSEETGARGSVDEWLTGSYALARDRPELFARATLVLNLDGIGWKGEKGTVNVSPEGRAFAAGIVSDLGLADRIKIVASMSTWVDAWIYSSVAGATTLYSNWEAEEYADYYHTDLDRCAPELLPNLETDLRVSTLALERADRADAPAASFTDLASWARSAFEADSKRVPDASFARLREALAAFEEAAAGEERRHKRAREDGEAALTAFNADRMAIRSRLVPKLVATAEYLAESRTYRYATDAARLAEILRELPRADLGEEEGRAQLVRVLEIMEAGDDFQDMAPTPSWTFQFSSRVLERIQKMMREQRSWALEHDQKQDTVSPEVFALYEEMRQALARKTTPWSYDASRAARKVEELRQEVLARLEANQAGVVAALTEATTALKNEPRP
jgi:hypothetical protein